MMEKILIVSNYYPPEKGAAANRIEQLSLKLKQNGYGVSVVCPLANYPKGELFAGYKRKFSKTENLNGISVSRLWIYPSNSKNIFKRILSISSFSAMLFFFLLFGKIPHKVVVQSPPLLLSFIAVVVLSWRKRKIILNVSDLWPSAAIELGVLKRGSFSHKMLLKIEKTIYRKATVVLGQSDEILTHVKAVEPGKSCFLYRNFPDHQSSFNQTETSGKIKLFYAGLLGVAQGVLDVCRQIDLEDLDMEFHIFGDGAEKTEIEKYISDNPSKNISFHGMLERNHLISLLETFDIAVVPLTVRIFGSVPSKIFEYSALGIPVLYFGGGEGEAITSEDRLGWVAKVGDFGELNARLFEIASMDRGELHQMKQRVFNHAAEHFNLGAQMAGLISEGAF